nr:hypothetical protein [Pseudomonas jessenii]
MLAMVVNDNACELNKRGLLNDHRQQAGSYSFPGMREEPFLLYRHTFGRVDIVQRAVHQQFAHDCQLLNRQGASEH